jgi:hypothetical protein
MAVRLIRRREPSRPPSLQNYPDIGGKLVQRGDRQYIRQRFSRGWARPTSPGRHSGLRWLVGFWGFWNIS